MTPHLRYAIRYNTPGPQHFYSRRGFARSGRMLDLWWPEDRGLAEKEAARRQQTDPRLNFEAEPVIVVAAISDFDADGEDEWGEPIRLEDPGLHDYFQQTDGSWQIVRMGIAQKC